MQRTRNIRYVEVAINQTGLVVINRTDPLKIVSIQFRNATGTATELATIMDGTNRTILNIQTNTVKDEIFVPVAPIELQGLVVTTSAQMHLWIGICGESNKGVLTEHGSICPGV